MRVHAYVLVCMQCCISGGKLLFLIKGSGSGESESYISILLLRI